MSEMRLYNVTGLATSYIVASSEEEAIAIYCRDVGDGDDEIVSELETRLLANDDKVDLPEEGVGGSDIRTAAEWVASAASKPGVIGGSL